MTWMAWLLSASAEEASLAAVVAAPACPSSVKALALPPGVEASRLQGSHLIVVLKGARRILRMNQGKLLETKDGPACWPIGLGFAPTGTKAVEGDGRTPEGLYATSDKPWSQYYAAIAVHYPGPHDLEEAIQAGRLDAATADSVRAAHQRGEKPPQKTPVGGEILIHGGGASKDWTLGCVAMEDKDIDRLRSTLPKDMVTEVLILP